MSTEIILKDLIKKFGDHTVIQDLSATIQRGEFFTLLGSSGCGKTTLLRMIAGFNSVESGTISFNGRIINDMQPNERNIGMVFQNYAIFPHMNAFDNVAYGLKQRKIAKNEIKQRVMEALEVVKIADLAERMPTNMSGGQQQRVALARALVIKPDVLLMDEPLSNLDAKLRIEMRSAIRGLQQEFGITTVYVTHDQEEALAVSDRIAVMKNGEIQQIGTPEEVFRTPSNLFVANFIGKANAFQGEIEEISGNGMRIRIADGTSVFASVQNDHASTGQQVTVTARPNAIMFAKDSGIDAVIRSAHFLGMTYQYTVETMQGITAEVQSDAAYGTLCSVGSKVKLELNENRINVFDTEDRAFAKVGSGNA